MFYLRFCAFVAGLPSCVERGRNAGDISIEPYFASREPKGFRCLRSHKRGGNPPPVAPFAFARV